MLQSLAIKLQTSKIRHSDSSLAVPKAVTSFFFLYIEFIYSSIHLQYSGRRNRSSVGTDIDAPMAAHSIAISGRSHSEIISDNSENDNIASDRSITSDNSNIRNFSDDNSAISSISSISLPSKQELTSESSKAEITTTQNITSDISYQQLNFFDNKSDSNSLEQSPCYPIIGSRTEDIGGSVGDADGNLTDVTYTNTVYYCKIHPDLGSTFLGEIELHCIEKEPDIHKAEILRILGLG